MNKNRKIDRDDTDCMGCPSRIGKECQLYKTELEVIGNVYVPCDECESDCAEDDGFTL